MRIVPLVLSSTLALAACASPAPRPTPPPAAAPTPPPPPAPVAPTAREQPPPPLDARPSPFPAVARTTYSSGLRLSVVPSHALPVIEIRAIVHAGMGFGPPGVSEVTARMLKEGGTRAHTSSEIVRRIETLGSSLDVSVGSDATRLSMRVVRGQLGDALDILAEVLRTPRFDPAELARLKTRMTDQAEDAARSSGTWSATRILFHALYPATSPYATYGAVPAEIAKVDAASVRDFHKRLYVPSNVDLIVAGDVNADADADGVAKAVDKAFGDWAHSSGGPAATPLLARLDFPEPTPPDATRVVIANRPKSVQSDVVVSGLFPERHASGWPADRVALQVLGGGLTGRLFLDVREKRSLAYRADARYLELARDAQPLFAYAGTQAPKTADAVQAILDDLAAMRSSPPTDDEVAAAKRFLSDIFAVRMETVGAVADMVAQLRELDLPDDYWDGYRAALRAVTTSQVDASSARVFSPEHALVVVAGDADAIADSLTRFGEVTVVDPEHDFRVLRTLPSQRTLPKSTAPDSSGSK